VAGSANWQQANFSIDAAWMSDRIRIDRCARFTNHYDFRRMQPKLSTDAADTFKLARAALKFIPSHGF
jgi:hypothetical protein